MKKLLLLVILFFLVFFLYAQGIDNTELNIIAKEYLEKTFQIYLTRTDLTVDDLSCTTDWERSSANNSDDTTYFYVEARFRNFPINRRTLSGRLTTSIVVRKVISRRGEISYEIRDADQNEKIILLVDDLLSDNLREALIINEINQHYGRPLGISIPKDRIEIFPDTIYSYVSAVINEDTIIYLRAVFRRGVSTTHPYDKIDIRQTQWNLSRVDHIFSCPFPDQSQIRTDARDDLFSYFSDVFTKANGRRTIDIEFKWTSGINNRRFTEYRLIETNGGMIKLMIKFQYDYGRLFYWKKYNAAAEILYEYDSVNNKFDFKWVQVIEHNAL